MKTLTIREYHTPLVGIQLLQLWLQKDRLRRYLKIRLQISLLPTPKSSSSKPWGGPRPPNRAVNKSHTVIRIRWDFKLSRLVVSQFTATRRMLSKAITLPPPTRFSLQKSVGRRRTISITLCSFSNSLSLQVFRLLTACVKAVRIHLKASSIRERKKRSREASCRQFKVKPKWC